MQIILGSSQHTEKADAYSGLVPWIGEGLLTSNGNKWRSHRKLLTPTFHLRFLKHFDLIVFVKKLLENKRPVEVHSFLSLCTLDIIC
ncbi:Cytochrome P450-like, partial [Frankliniella occidentalis]